MSRWCLDFKFQPAYQRQRVNAAAEVHRSSGKMGVASEIKCNESR